MTRYKLLGGNVFDKKEFIFLNWAFLLRNCQILHVFQSSLLRIHFWYGAARIRIRNDFFPDSGPDSAKSFGSDRIRIHNTACEWVCLPESGSWLLVLLPGPPAAHLYVCGGVSAAHPPRPGGQLLPGLPARLCSLQRRKVFCLYFRYIFDVKNSKYFRYIFSIKKQ
jgi:hypothetical protein